MSLVYLDQCVISRFLEKPENEQWRCLREIILKGNANCRILCPTSLEHVAEIAPLRDNDAIVLDELMRKLSHGYALLTEPLLIAHQIISKLRRHKSSPGRFMQKGFLRPIITQGVLTELREMKAKLDKHNAWMMQGVNELNMLIRDGLKPGKDMLQCLIKRQTDFYVKHLRAEVLSSLKSGHVIVRPEDYNCEITNWMSVVVYELINKHRMSLVEAGTLCDLLLTEKLNFIPTLKIKAELVAMQFFRREKIEPRDQYDITRAACALPYADIFITDGGKASALKELKLDAEYETEIFSLKKSDLKNLMARLGEIC